MRRVSQALRYDAAMPTETWRVVADAFRRLGTEQHASAASWTAGEIAVWAIVNVRCQIDMGGMSTVFTDCDVHPRDFIQSLRLLGETGLASVWADACATLEREGFLAEGRWTGADASAHDHLFDSLSEVVADRLWDLDDRLAAALSERSPGRQGRSG